MRDFIFPAWCKSGKFCSGETMVEVSLTDEEAERLVKFGTDPEVLYSYRGFYNCRALNDKVYKIAVVQITQEQKEWMSEDDEEEAEILNDPNWRADDLYEVGVEFPRDFEKLLKNK